MLEKSRVDEWVMMEELWRFRDGRFNLTYLWTPYWGHRIPAPWLVFLIDERLLHFSVGASQRTHASVYPATLSTVEWKVLRRGLGSTGGNREAGVSFFTKVLSQTTDAVRFR